ncbi:MAG: dihydroorotate dehydrogenase [Halanaerobiales bacterium]
MTNINSAVKLASIKLKNPVITASGTCGFGQELTGFFDIEKLGGLTVKGITIKPSRGNTMPRIAETPAGLLNSIGLENPGINSFIENKLKMLKQYKLPVIVNISGHSIDDFAYIAEKLAPYSEIDALEVNVSCPNIAGGGMAFGTDEKLVYKVTEVVKNNYPKDIIVKLSPNVTDITAVAKAAEEAGADIISLINTLLGMAIDVKKEKPVLGNIFGGLSGPAIKPVALRMVYQVAEAVEAPIIGMGGIMNGEDALEFIMAGASAVAVGTATLINPDACLKISKEIELILKEKKIDNINSLVGIAHK